MPDESTRNSDQVVGITRVTLIMVTAGHFNLVIEPTNTISVNVRSSVPL